MSFPEIATVLTRIIPVILIAGIIIGIVKYRYLNTVKKCILWYMGIMLISDLSARIVGEMLGDNFFLFLIYSLVEAILFIVFYFKFLYKAKHRILFGVCMLGLVYIISEIILFESIDAREFQPYAKVVDNFIIILMALVYFHEKMSGYDSSRWENFKLNAVILSYFTINLIFFLPLNFLINEGTNLKFYIWTANLFVLVIYYLYLTTLLWKNGRTRG